MAKYDALRRHLEMQSGMYSGMSFDEIADLVGGLPPSAFEYRGWWANEEAGSQVQAQAWVNADWETHEVDFSARSVVFVRRAGGRELDG